jgi:hypothetical protein
MTEKELLHKVEMLEDLAAKQNKALGMANGLLDLKDQLVRLCEEETEFYKRLNKKARRALWIAFGWIVIRCTIDIIHLLS